MIFTTAQKVRLRALHNDLALFISMWNYSGTDCAENLRKILRLQKKKQNVLIEAIKIIRHFNKRNQFKKDVTCFLKISHDFKILLF